MATEDPLIAEANRLYWESDLSVGTIAQQLGLSRRALYGALQPEASGVSCPDCGTEMGFANRSAQLAGEAQCPGCGLEADVAAAPAPAGHNGGPPEATEPEVEQELTAGPRAPLDLEALDLRERAVMIGGAALAGVFVGAVAAFVASRR
jgi:hypothetical protein